MPRRKQPLATGECYHIYNRGVARQPVFLSKRDYERFLLTLRVYRVLTPPRKLSSLLDLPKTEQAKIFTELDRTREVAVDVISLVLMPNHFHLLMMQRTERGISVVMSRVLNSYARYFNTRYGRVGPVFQGMFKAVRVETTEQLLHLSRYIHLNPVVSHVVKESEWLSYPWSSFSDFLKGKSGGLVQPDLVLGHFSSPESYKQFVLDRLDYAKQLEAIKHLTFEHDDRSLSANLLHSRSVRHG